MIFNSWYLSVKKNKKKELSFNFGPNTDNEYTVERVLSAINKYNKNAKWKKFKKTNIIESNLLKLNSDKASNLLNWRCILNFEDTIKLTSQWYIAQSMKKNMEKFTIDQINYYLSKDEN